MTLMLFLMKQIFIKVTMCLAYKPVWWQTFFFFMATSVVQIFYASRKNSNMSLSHLAIYSEHEYIYTHTHAPLTLCPGGLMLLPLSPSGQSRAASQGRHSWGRGCFGTEGLAPLWSWKQFQFEHKLRKTWGYDPKILVLCCPYSAWAHYPSFLPDAVYKNRHWLQHN